MIDGKDCVLFTFGSNFLFNSILKQVEYKKRIEHIATLMVSLHRLKSR